MAMQEMQKRLILIIRGEHKILILSKIDFESLQRLLDRQLKLLSN